MVSQVTRWNKEVMRQEMVCFFADQLVSIFVKPKAVSRVWMGNFHFYRGFPFLSIT
jgi:hypothetical protein